MKTLRKAKKGSSIINEGDVDLFNYSYLLDWTSSVRDVVQVRNDLTEIAADGDHVGTIPQLLVTGVVPVSGVRNTIGIASMVRKRVVHRDVLWVIAWVEFCLASSTRNPSQLNEFLDRKLHQIAYPASSDPVDSHFPWTRKWFSRELYSTDVHMLRSFEFWLTHLDVTGCDWFMAPILRHISNQSSVPIVIGIMDPTQDWDFFSERMQQVDRANPDWNGWMTKKYSDARAEDIFHDILHMKNYYVSVVPKCFCVLLKPGVDPLSNSEYRKYIQSYVLNPSRTAVPSKITLIPDKVLKSYMNECRTAMVRLKEKNPSSAVLKYIRI